MNTIQQSFDVYYEQIKKNVEMDSYTEQEKENFKELTKLTYFSSSYMTMSLLKEIGRKHQQKTAFMMYDNLEQEAKTYIKHAGL